MSKHAFRIESDFLGEREVPEHAYYGIQTIRGAENFPITGHRLNPALIRALGIVKKAAALANRDTGYMPATIANVIAAAADDVIAHRFDYQFIVDPIQGGAGTSINMNANEVIANRALEILGEPKGNHELVSPNTHVNMAQSTNDALPTAVGTGLNADPAYIERVVRYLAELSGYPIVRAENLVDATQNTDAYYETAARIAREANLTGKSVRELILRDKVLDEERLNEILEPYQMTRPGIAGGYTHPKAEPGFREQE